MDRPFIVEGGEDDSLIWEDPLKVLFALGGFYKCPKDASGRRLGPLVGYAGRDDLGRQYVGDLYVNFAEAEQWPWIYDAWVARLVVKLEPLRIDTFMGMPMGSILTAAAIARTMQRRVIFAEKKVTALATESSREKSELILTRHGVSKNERVAICEDVTNNFSTTAEAVVLVRAQGGEVAAVVTLLNRSIYTDHGGIPVIALVREPMPQYQQDDPEVAADVTAGNVVWKVKPEWSRLREVMERLASR